MTISQVLDKSRQQSPHKITALPRVPSSEPIHTPQQQQQQQGNECPWEESSLLAPLNTKNKHTVIIQDEIEEEEEEIESTENTVPAVDNNATVIVIEENDNNISFLRYYSQCYYA